MNVKRFVWSCVAVFAVFVVLPAVNNTLLNVLIPSVWEDASEVLRPVNDSISLAWVFLLTSAVFTVVFCYIFIRGYEAKGLKEGLRYGVLISLLVVPGLSYEAYVSYRIPVSFAHMIFVQATITTCVGGLVLAAVYRPAETVAE